MDMDDFCKRHGIRIEDVADSMGGNLQKIRKHAEDGERLLKLYMDSSVEKFGYKAFKRALKCVVTENAKLEDLETPDTAEKAARVCRDMMAIIKLEEMAYEGGTDFMKSFRERN